MSSAGCSCALAARLSGDTRPLLGVPEYTGASVAVMRAALLSRHASWCACPGSCARCATLGGEVGAQRAAADRRR